MSTSRRSVNTAVLPIPTVTTRRAAARSTSTLSKSAPTASGFDSADREEPQPASELSPPLLASLPSHTERIVDSVSLLGTALREQREEARETSEHLVSLISDQRARTEETLQLVLDQQRTLAERSEQNLQSFQQFLTRQQEDQSLFFRELISRLPNPKGKAPARAASPSEVSEQAAGPPPARVVWADDVDELTDRVSLPQDDRPVLAHKDLPEFRGRPSDSVDEWIKSIEKLWSLYKCSERRLLCLLPTAFPKDSPAASWYNSLPIGYTALSSWIGWKDEMRQQFGALEQRRQRRLEYDRCVPSPKYKSFEKFLEAKMRLRAQAFGADAEREAPMRPLIDACIEYLPPGLRTVFRMCHASIESPMDLKMMVSDYFKSPETAKTDPCYREEAPAKPAKERRTASAPSKAERPSGTERPRPAPDVNKKPPGECRLCKKEGKEAWHWERYCFRNPDRTDPPDGKSGPYGKPKGSSKPPQSSTSRTNQARSYFQGVDDSSAGTLALGAGDSYAVIAHEGMHLVGHFQQTSPPQGRTAR